MTRREATLIVDELAARLTTKLVEDTFAKITAERMFEHITASMLPLLVEAVDGIRNDDRDNARAVMRRCAERFREYEKHHRDKRDHIKADSNAAMALLSERFLAETGGGGGIVRQRGDPDGINKDRAAWAGYAVEQFRSLTNCDDEDAFGDLLCDLMHFADAKGIDFNHVLAGACSNYDAETYPDPIEDDA